MRLLNLTNPKNGLLNRSGSKPDDISTVRICTKFKWASCQRQELFRPSEKSCIYPMKSKWEHEKARSGERAEIGRRIMKGIEKMETVALVLGVASIAMSIFAMIMRALTG